jgi:hypothetical protein
MSAFFTSGRPPLVNAEIRHYPVKNPTFSWGKLPRSDDFPRYLLGGRDGSVTDQGGAIGNDSGYFSNPVIAGFHPDPSICRAGADYYLACSSFEYSPGVPVFRSRDLMHWEQIGNALQNYALPDTTPSSGGIYAPTLRYHDGRFWLITTDVSGGGTVLFTAAEPAGPWSEPIRVPAAQGFDPDLAWDDEGRCWCTFAGIEQVRIDPQTGQALSEARHLWSGTPGAQWPEAPHLYQIGAYLVPDDRRGRHRARPLRVGGARSGAGRGPSSRARPTRSSLTAAPASRSRAPGMQT